MKKVARIISTVALIATLSAPAWAEGIGDNMSTFAGSGQVGTVMGDNARYWTWGSGLQGNQGTARQGANSEAVKAYEGGVSPQGSQLPDLIAEMEAAGLL